MGNATDFKVYQASINRETISRWRGIVSVWSAPGGPPSGARVIDEIKEPVEVTVENEEEEPTAVRKKVSKVKYGKGKEGWVSSEALTAN